MSRIWENLHSNMCVQRRHKPACAFAQSDRNHRLREETLSRLVYEICQEKILIRLRECAGWSESSLGAHVRRSVFWQCDSFVCLIDLKTMVKGTATFMVRIMVPIADDKALIYPLKYETIARLWNCLKGLVLTCNTSCVYEPFGHLLSFIANVRKNKNI